MIEKARDILERHLNMQTRGHLEGRKIVGGLRDMESGIALITVSVAMRSTLMEKKLLTKVRVRTAKQVMMNGKDHVAENAMLEVGGITTEATTETRIQD